MTVFLFSGQGSQRKGMGNALFDEFKEVTARADEILGYSIQVSTGWLLVEQGVSKDCS